MCGIAGILQLNGQPVAPALLRKMTDAMAHRGPDGEGCYTMAVSAWAIVASPLSIFRLRDSNHGTPDGSLP